MSYTREAISTTPQQATPDAALPEREFNPYEKTQTRLEAVQAAAQSGQPDKGGAATEQKPTSETVTLSPQVTALARKEQAVRKQEKALKDREASIAAKAAELSRLEEMERRLKAKDYSVLDGMVDYTEFTQHELNRQMSADPQAQAYKKLEEEVSGLKKSLTENTSKQFEAAVNERRAASTKHIASDEKLSRIDKAVPELKLSEAVVQHILDTWEHDSKELSVEDAAKEVHEVLIEKAKKWASILDEPAPAADEKKQLPPLKSPQLKTLTNQVTSGDYKAPAKPLHLMTDSERYAEARRRAVEKMGLNQKG